jgi:hypothetical protein
MILLQKFRSLVLDSMFVTMLAGCAGHGPSAEAQSASPRDGRYPAHWWTPVPKESAPAWEILPQECAPGEVILSKRNELGLLSNFTRTPFEFRGKHYEAIEGLWQSMLYPENAEDPRAKAPGVKWEFTREQVAGMVAFEAKHAGELAEANLKKLGIDWVSFEGERFPYKAGKDGRQYQLIRAAMTEKLRQNPRVREVLLQTGNLILKPDHHQSPDDPPSWRYFEIWMELRSEVGATFL